MDRDKLTETGLKYLEGLGRIPATSFYEQPVAKYIRAQCEEAGLDVETDPFGNVLATRPGIDPDAPGIAFVAHMDHPGFEAIALEGENIRGRVLGGLPEQGTGNGIDVRFINPMLEDPLPGAVLGRVGPREENNLLFSVKAGVDRDHIGRLPCAVVFDLPDFDLDRESRLIRMRAADDLAGCASIMAVLAGAIERQTPGAVYGLFTRAEEVGLIGARLAAEDELLPRDTIIVSVETSSALPGAEIGEGPVIRTGDRLTTFDHRAEEYLQAARDVLETPRVQRQLMRAGTCEGSAFARFGYQTTGLAYPLGAWHNNGPEMTIRPEFIHLDDFATGIALMSEAADLAGSRPESGTAKRLLTRPENEEQRLRESAE